MVPEPATLDVPRSTSTGDLSKVPGRVDLCHGPATSKGRQYASHDVRVPTLQSDLGLQPFSGNGRCICEHCAETNAGRCRARRRLALGRGRYTSSRRLQFTAPQHTRATVHHSDIGHRMAAPGHERKSSTRTNHVRSLLNSGHRNEESARTALICLFSLSTGRADGYTPSLVFAGHALHCPYDAEFRARSRLPFYARSW